MYLSRVRHFEKNCKVLFRLHETWKLGLYWKNMHHCKPRPSGMMIGRCWPLSETLCSLTSPDASQHNYETTNVGCLYESFVTFGVSVLQALKWV
jgi:hypothetical protein